MSILLTIIGSLLVFLGSYVIVMNWGVVVQWLVRRKHSSWVPIIGGLLCSVGLALLPIALARTYWWVPFLIDWGCIPGMTHALGYFGWKYLAGRKSKRSDK